MEYKKVLLVLEPDNEINREILIAELGEAGFDSFTETDDAVEAYIPASQFSEEKLSQDFLSKYGLFTCSYTTDTIPHQNWNEIWENNYFKPLIIEDKCLIRAPFHTKYPNAQYEIIIEPNMAFGTGNHETTSLMISSILKIDLTGKKVLDMGCGTGILAILSSMARAAEITAIDNDENAFNTTIENTKNNNISNIKVKLGGAETLKEDKFDIILANIQRNILLNDLPFYIKVLNHGGLIIMSGFYKEDLPAIHQRAFDLGLKSKVYEEKNNWVVAQFILE